MCIRDREYSMALYYHVTGEQRKALVTAVSAYTGTPAVYQNAPTFAYAIGEYSVCLLYTSRCV